MLRNLQVLFFFPVLKKILKPNFQFQECGSVQKGIHFYFCLHEITQNLSYCIVKML